jgi:hypothetical protein
MFGSGDKRQAGIDALRTEVNRLAALTLDALGAEVLTRVYGPGGPGAGGAALTIGTAADVFITEISSWSNEDQTREQLVAIVGEGLQRAEHAGLLRDQIVLVGNEHWALGWSVTRAGGAALAQATVLAAITRVAI